MITDEASETVGEAPPDASVDIPESSAEPGDRYDWERRNAFVDVLVSGFTGVTRSNTMKRMEFTGIWHARTGLPELMELLTNSLKIATNF